MLDSIVRKLVNVLDPDDMREMTSLGFECGKLLELLTLIDAMSDRWLKDGLISEEVSAGAKARLNELWAAWREAKGK